MMSHALLDVASGANGTAMETSAQALFDYIAKYAKLVPGASADTRMHQSLRTIAASGTLDLDLAGGITDTDGNTITFTRIRAIIVHARSTNVNAVVFGNAAANQALGPMGAAAHTIAVARGGTMMLCNPSAAAWPITAATADHIQFANGGAGTGVLFDLCIIGDV